MVREVIASELNVRVTCKAFDYAEQAAGGTLPVLRESFDDWFKVEQLSGSTSFQQAQQISTSQYKLTCRYNAALNENWIFYFEGLYLKVDQMQVDNPAYKRYFFIYCSTTKQFDGWS